MHKQFNMTRIRILASLQALLLSGVLAASAYAGWDEGLAASKAGNHEQAFAELLPLAEQGHGSAQSMIGVMYYNGEGVPQDYDAAMVWLMLAANQGYGVAQFNVGVMYDNGHGVDQDFAEAFKWYRLAAQNGYAPAQFNLGAMYSNGEGVEQDVERAHMWFNIAAAHGNNSAAESKKQLEASMSAAQIANAQKMTGVCIDSRYQDC